MTLGRFQSRWALVGALCIGALVLGAATVLGGSWLVLAAVAAGAIALLLLRSPFAGLLAVIFFLPLERVGAYESAAGTLRASQVIAALTLAIFVVKVLQRGRRAFRPNPLALPLTAFLAVMVIGCAGAPNTERAITTLVLTAFTIAVSLLVPQLITTRRHLHRALLVLVISATLVSLFGLFQFLGDSIGLPSTVTGLRSLYTKEVFGFPRIQSTALEPLYFANYLLLPLGLVYALFVSRSVRFSRWLLFGLLALFGANLLLTVSRGGYFGAGVMAVLITLIGFRDFFRARTIVPLLIGIVLVGYVVVRALGVGDVNSGLNLETFTTHIQNAFYGASYNERVETYNEARQLFWSSPFVGIGPGNFGPSVAAHPLLEPEGGWKIVNNESLELLAETGIAGFTAIVVGIILLLLRTIKALRRASAPHDRAIVVGLFAAVCGILAQYQTFSILYIMHIWVGIGLLVAAQNILLVGEVEHD